MNGRFLILRVLAKELATTAGESPGVEARSFASTLRMTVFVA